MLVHLRFNDKQHAWESSTNGYSVTLSLFPHRLLREVNAVLHLPRQRRTLGFDHTGSSTLLEVPLATSRHCAQDSLSMQARVPVEDGGQKEKCHTR